MTGIPILPKLRFYLIYIVCCLLFLVSCLKDETSDPLVGTWNYSSVFYPDKSFSVREGYDARVFFDIKMTINENYSGTWDNNLTIADSTRASLVTEPEVEIYIPDIINTRITDGVEGNLLLDLADLEMDSAPFVFGDEVFSFELLIKEEFFTLIYENSETEYTYELYDDLLVLTRVPPKFLFASGLRITFVFRKE